MIIYIGADHRGFHLKEILKEFIAKLGHEYVDVGSDLHDENDDYPDFAKLVAESVSKNLNEDKGIVICRSGAGVDIVANKFKGIRSVLAINAEQAALTRKDDDTNVLALAAGFISEDEAKKIIEAWLSTLFSGKDKDKRRIEKIAEVEKNR